MNPSGLSSVRESSNKGQDLVFETVMLFTTAILKQAQKDLPKWDTLRKKVKGVGKMVTTKNYLYKQELWVWGGERVRHLNE